MKPHVLLGNSFYISGDIPRLTVYETGQRGHVRCASIGLRTSEPIVAECATCTRIDAGICSE